MGIEFERHTQEASFHSPLEDFERVTIEVEVRVDPLTGRQTRIVPASFVMPEDEPAIDEVVNDAEGCFFCPDMVGEVTPTYDEVLGVDRGEVGEATSFPNLNPYGSYSNVVALTEDHFRPIDRIDAGVLADGFRAATDFVDAVLDHDGSASHASINMNFLRPAGSSIVHPHLQTLVDDRGTNYQRRLREAATAFRAEHGRPYWSALLEATEGSGREVARTGPVTWIAPFAPRHHWHVRGIATGSAGGRWDDGAIDDVARGIERILGYYHELGLNSFNLACFLEPAEPDLPPIVDVVGRSVFDRYYWSDSPFFPTLHDEAVVDEAPETYAAEVASRF